MSTFILAENVTCQLVGNVTFALFASPDLMSKTEFGLYVEKKKRTLIRWEHEVIDKVPRIRIPYYNMGMFEAPKVAPLLDGYRRLILTAIALYRFNGLGLSEVIDQFECMGTVDLSRSSYEAWVNSKQDTGS